MNLKFVVLVAASCGAMLLALVSASGDDKDWPGWLGPQRNGWVEAFAPPKQWPAELQMRWQAEVGSGYGSPLIADETVYQHARQGEIEVLWCLDLKTGETKWRKEYEAPFKVGGGGEYHGKGPKSSPILADSRIFTLSITGVLSAWDAKSGELLWRRDYASQYQQHDRPYPYWGVSTSPIVDGDRVIFHVGPDKEGMLVALDVATGKEMWTHGKDGASYSSPLAVEIGGVRQIVQWNHRALVGVESSTGKFLWEHPFPHVGSDQNMPTPTFHDGMILLGGENRGIHGLRPELKNGAWSVKQLWHQDEVALDMSSAVMNNGLLYGFSHYGKGRFFCLDPASGDVLWQGPGRTGNNVMFLAVPNHVVALVNTGELRILAANRERYEQVATYRVGETQTWAPPVLLSDGILVKDENTLRLWSLESTDE